MKRQFKKRYLFSCYKLCQYRILTADLTTPLGTDSQAVNNVHTANQNTMLINILQFGLFLPICNIIAISKRKFFQNVMFLVQIWFFGNQLYREIEQKDLVNYIHLCSKNESSYNCNCIFVIVFLLRVYLIVTLNVLYCVYLQYPLTSIPCPTNRTPSFRYFRKIRLSTLISWMCL